MATAFGEAIPEQEIEFVRERVQRWFAREARDLPWRRTRDPYRILVSEVMLQQTQAERVIPFYEAFVTRFPTLERLAAAPLAEVIAAWGGLGYNRRAVYLWRAARQIVERYGGAFPRDRRELERLPGVGRYTAGAVLCFAFGEPVAFWDTNIARVLTRVFVGPEARLTGRQLDELAGRVLPRDRAYAWNQALMELGARVCTNRRPRCGQCPVREVCRSAGTSGSVRRRGERFVGSRRYYRGRIVAALRRVPSGLSLEELARLLREGVPSSDAVDLTRLVEELAGEGLLELR
ncbi:MAG: A/G-specific adenine glycosylase, partial [Thermomicrobium sp.]|nr:A/G-specific adenine glycosylase [Thermomicrobium sp.]